MPTMCSNRAYRVQDALGNFATTVFDAAGNVWYVVNQLGHRTTLGYDELNRLVTVTDALGGVATTAYDPVGNVTATVDQLGQAQHVWLRLAGPAGDGEGPPRQGHHARLRSRRQPDDPD